MSDLPAVDLAPPTFREVGTMLIAGIRQYYTYEERGGIPRNGSAFSHISATSPAASAAPPMASACGSAMIARASTISAACR